MGLLLKLCYVWSVFCLCALSREGNVLSSLLVTPYGLVLPSFKPKCGVGLKVRLIAPDALTCST